MNRFDRLFGILLLLRGGWAVSAAELAGRFRVSRRTIYRDLDALSVAGVPVYAERGRGGGVRLLEGYFLPPLMFSRGEAIALLLGLTLLGGLRAPPYPTEIQTAAGKLLAAVPDRLRLTLSRAERLLGVERPSADLLHPEPAQDGAVVSEDRESAALTAFVDALLDGRTVCMRYRSPYRGREEEVTLAPLGLFWDRDRWYLVGRQSGSPRPRRLWRADRVLALAPAGVADEPPADFDVRALLGRVWLREAMEEWRGRVPVTIRVTPAQVSRLREDWYYRHARFEPLDDEAILMTFGEADPPVVLELLRWLGPGAELVSPPEWRALVRDQLRQMLADHGGDAPEKR